MEGVEKKVFHIGFLHRQQDILHSIQYLDNLVLAEYFLFDHVVGQLGGDHDNILIIMKLVDLKSLRPNSYKIRLVGIQVIDFLI